MNDFERDRQDRQDEDLSRHLHNVTSADIDAEDKAHLRKYTKVSHTLNHNLLKGARLSPDHEAIHKAILRHAKPSGVEFDIYSGTGNKNFAELAKKSKDGILHSPAHISATHAKHVADEFAFNGSKERHMIKVAVHHKDPVLHVSKLSNYHDEHETIIPAGTKLKYSHSEEGTFDKRHLFGGKPVQIHHFTIHREGLNESAETRKSRIKADSAHLFKKTNHGLNHEEIKSLERYKSSSSSLNAHLIYGNGEPEDNPWVGHNLAHAHRTIIKHAKPIGKKMSFYSGTGTDFGHLARQSKDHILHSPAHISATHDLDIARGFAEFRKSGSGAKHIVHINAEPHHKALHVSDPDDDTEERETIIPAGSKLKWSHSTKHKIDGDLYHIHHFSIHDDHLHESAETRKSRIKADSEHLYNTTHSNKMDKNEKDSIEFYKSSSYYLNKHLLSGEPVHDTANLHHHEINAHRTILKHAKPIGKKMNFYSGTGTDFGKLAKESKDHILYSPAHISASHDLSSAAFFGDLRRKDGQRHIVHIKAEPHHKALHVSEPEEVTSERETIIPAGAKLKYSHSTKHKIDHNHYHIHHFKLHSQGE